MTFMNGITLLSIILLTFSLLSCGKHNANSQDLEHGACHALCGNVTDYFQDAEHLELEERSFPYFGSDPFGITNSLCKLDPFAICPPDMPKSKKVYKISEQVGSPCIPKDFGKGSFVCVCNSSYCDTVSWARPPNKILEKGNGDEHLVQIFTSTKTGSRFHPSLVGFGNDQREPYRREDLVDENDIISDSLNPVAVIAGNHLNKFKLRRDIKHQRVIGYGGAFTDAAGLNIGKLSRPAQEQLMKAYFGEEGIDYSLCRVPIGGTDFSTRAYTYDDGDIDEQLLNFELQPEDLELKIPYIKWGQALRGTELKLLASPWSPPAWMKSTGRLAGTLFPGILKREFYQSWAEYFVRFITEYNSNGIEIWGITTGNEPENGFIPLWPFNCLGWRPEMMRTFLAENLGPTLKSAGMEPKVIMLDDNKKFVHGWSQEILENYDSGQYVDGLGTHWYYDILVSPEAILSQFHRSYPEQLIIQTEACLGFTPVELEKVSLGNWERGETYLDAIIRDSNSFVGGWIDWNLALDEEGGPNWAGLRADAAIIVNPDNDEFYKQPIYYAMGHMSKFVPPDSVRVELEQEFSLLSPVTPAVLKVVAFQRPDGGMVVVFVNKLDYEAKIELKDEEKGTIYLDIPPKAFQTLVYW